MNKMKFGGKINFGGCTTLFSFHFKPYFPSLSFAAKYEYKFYSILKNKVLEYEMDSYDSV